MESFDTYDLNNFYIFFKELYRKKCTKQHMQAESGDREGHTATDLVDDEPNVLNSAFTLEEVDSGIRKLKLNKSSSLDLVSNEMLKHSLTPLRSVLVILFNGCLLNGIYPWNTSVTSPLHKKGCKEDPDNYRAITLGSCLGKLFSSLLLDRLLQYRKDACPDYPNQLGFCVGSQTSDHILVLKTVLDKYVKRNRKRVYSCFVDYKKAFDRVCRQALMYKLHKMGIGGNFFLCLQFMYSHSTSRIKLIQKLSDAIDVELGTEQGHPLSPELFKIFIHDLSRQLNEIGGLNLPNLNNMPINHLLWADDLVLLALDAKSLQALLNVLQDYVVTWELEVNISKTNVMVFSTSGRLLKESYQFVLGEMKIKPVRSYTYLGIKFSLTGSFKEAIRTLTAKGKQAFFQIKKTVDTRALSVKSMFRLFDALIMPIISYACQIWIPSTNFGKAVIIAASDSTANLAANDPNLIQHSTKDIFETFHLQYMKWVLGLHRKASNYFCYGDTGRLVTAIQATPQCIKYYNRVADKATSDPDSFVARAFAEQKSLNLEWYTMWHKMVSCNQRQGPSALPSILPCYPMSCKKWIADLFVNEWDSGRRRQTKLHFLNSIKPEFGYEPYLDIEDAKARKELSRIRASAHDLKVETSRYSNRHMSSATDRACRFCCPASEIGTLKLLEALPMFEPEFFIETEEHVMTECPGYHLLRTNLSETLKCHLLLQQYAFIMYDPRLAKELGLFLRKSFKIRNDTDS